jgi:hypothetical protein
MAWMACNKCCVDAEVFLAQEKFAWLWRPVIWVEGLPKLSLDLWESHSDFLHLPLDF